MSETIKIITADDHPIFRRGVCSVIKSDPNFEIVGEAGDGKELLEILKTVTPDIIILDVNMPEMDGIEAAQIIVKEYPAIKLVFLTFERDVEILNALKKLKVKGYMLKESAEIEIVDCIKKVAGGSIYISAKITDLLLDLLEDDPVESDKNILLSTLTATELKILKLMAESKTNKEIAEKLFISVRTAENHRANICSKLKLTGNHSLFKFAIENREMIMKKRFV